MPRPPGRRSARERGPGRRLDRLTRAGRSLPAERVRGREAVLRSARRRPPSPRRQLPLRQPAPVGACAARRPAARARPDAARGPGERRAPGGGAGRRASERQAQDVPRHGGAAAKGAGDCRNGPSRVRGPWIPPNGRGRNRWRAQRTPPGSGRRHRRECRRLHHDGANRETRPERLWITRRCGRRRTLALGR